MSRYRASATVLATAVDGCRLLPCLASWLPGACPALRHSHVRLSCCYGPPRHMGYVLSTPRKNRKGVWAGARRGQVWPGDAQHNKLSQVIWCPGARACALKPCRTHYPPAWPPHSTVAWPSSPAALQPFRRALEEIKEVLAYRATATASASENPATARAEAGRDGGGPPLDLADVRTWPDDMRAYALLQRPSPPTARDYEIAPPKELLAWLRTTAVHPDERAVQYTEVGTPAVEGHEVRVSLGRAGLGRTDIALHTVTLTWRAASSHAIYAVLFRVSRQLLS